MFVPLFPNHEALKVPGHNCVSQETRTINCLDKHGSYISYKMFKSLHTALLLQLCLLPLLYGISQFQRQFRHWYFYLFYLLITFPQEIITVKALPSANVRVQQKHCFASIFGLVHHKGRLVHLIAILWTWQSRCLYTAKCL